MLNPKQFPKARKKRAVDPNAPPRPNLLSQDKKIRDMEAGVTRRDEYIQRLEKEIEKLRSRALRTEMNVELLSSILKRR